MRCFIQCSYSRCLLRGEPGRCPDGKYRVLTVLSRPSFPLLFPFRDINQGLISFLSRRKLTRKRKTNQTTKKHSKTNQNNNSNQTATKQQQQQNKTQGKTTANKTKTKTSENCANIFICISRVVVLSICMKQKYFSASNRTS